MKLNNCYVNCIIVHESEIFKCTYMVFFVIIYYENEKFIYTMCVPHREQVKSHYITLHMLYCK